jgi:hypothetical protein
MTNHQNSSTQADWPQEWMPRRWIEKLFEMMAMSYGRKFLDMWGENDLEEQKRYWAQRLGTVTAKQMQAGVSKMEKLAWPPTLPEFKMLCQPEIKPLDAYYEAVEGSRSREQGEVGTWSHPAIFWASVRVSAFDLKSLSYSQIKERWNSALESELAKSEWPEIPEPVLALPAPGIGAADKAAATRRLQELKAVGITKKVNEEVDHKAWAKKIMKRHANGDKSLTFIQIKFAKEALNIGD